MRIIAFILLGFVCIFSGPVYAETLKFAIGEWAPYTSEKDPKGKIAEVVVKEAFQLEGINVEYFYFPWKRSYHSVLRGQYAGTFPWYFNDDRKKEVLVHKEPLVMEKEVFFHLKTTKFDWKNFVDLQKYAIGGTRGYVHVKVLESNGLKVQLVNEDILNFRKALKGRVEAFPASYVVGSKLLHQSFPPEDVIKFTTHPRPLQEGEMFLLFSKKLENVSKHISSFDKGLRKLKTSGRYKSILAEFLNSK